MLQKEDTDKLKVNTNKVIKEIQRVNKTTKIRTPLQIVLK